MSQLPDSGTLYWCRHKNAEGKPDCGALFREMPNTHHRLCPKHRTKRVRLPQPESF